VNRLCRIIFNALTALSLVLCLAAGVLWIRSSLHNQSRFWTAGAQAFALSSYQGRLVFWNATRSADPPPYFWTYYYGYREHGQAWANGSDGACDGGLQTVWKWADFVTYSHERDMGMDHRRFTLRYCVLFPVLLIPVAWFILLKSMEHRQQRQRLATHSCAICGYDLRATPTRCPECGSIRASASTTKTPHS
jgi:hypothetical protein